jgi:hypothetical protein
MKYLQFKNCTFLDCSENDAVLCNNPKCEAFFRIVDGPPYAEEESQQMPGDTQNPIPSADSGASGIERSESRGNTRPESLSMPFLPRLAFHKPGD